MVTWKHDLALSVCLFCLSALFFITSRGYPDTNGYFPGFIACFLAVLSLLLCISAIRRRTADKEPFANWSALRAPALIVLLTGGFIVILPYIGFIPSCVLLTLSIFLSLGYHDKRVALAVALCVTLGIYATFHMALSVPLPVGSLWTGW